MDTDKNFVYILQCKDQTLYTGWTKDLNKRIKAHNEGKGAKYTRARLPVTLVHFEEFSSKSEALKRECAIKSMTKCEKLELLK